MSSASIEGDTVEAIGVAGLDDEVVTIGRAELEELRALAHSASRPGRAAEPAADAARREEGLARELAARDRKVADLESAYRKALRDRELATALAGKPLVAGAAIQLIRLWRDDLDVYEESGEYRVAARDGRAVAQWVADRLGKPDYAHFCLPPSRGGSGAKGLSQSGGPGAAAPSAKTLGEAVISQWRESAAGRAAPTTGLTGWGRRG
ncbi:MAG TPA: hypothetical protein VG406_08350 [Isosphaeraceae bacterium]|nr:hypothetical protein [Isosphaeraceae bacterium]